MSTQQEKRPHVLSAENGLFYGADKVMTDFGNKLKVYASLSGAQAAARMLAKGGNVLAPISLDDAKNGADKAKNDEATQTVPLPSAEAALKEKEARKFKEMLQASYGHITPDATLQEKIHLFTLSPVGKRIGFNADYIRQLLSEYDDATASVPTPANKKALLDAIKVEQGKLDTFKITLADDAEALEYVSMGIKSKIAPLQQELSELPDENELVFCAVVLLPLCGKLFSEKALRPSTRGKNGNGNAWTMGEGQKLAFDYTSSRVCQNGLDLSKLGLTSIQGFIYHPDHEFVEGLNIPAGKLAVVSHDHVLIGQIDAKQALGNVLGEAVFEIVKPDVDRAKFVQAISSTGVDAFQSKKSTVLSKTAKTVSASIITNGQHSELETVGNQSDTEKEHAPIAE